MAAVGLVPAGAQAATAKTWPAVVRSVDGPGLVTVIADRHAWPVRIAGIDSPDAASGKTPAECGAPQATAALQALVAAHPKLTLTLVKARGATPGAAAATGPVRDLTGRYLAYVDDPTGTIDLGVQLIEEGWAREGLPVTSSGQAVRGSLWALEAASTPGLPVVDPATHLETTASVGDVGLWTVCGGRVHLPATAPVPAFAPAAWKVDGAGALTAIGALAAKVSAAGKGTTVAQVRAAFPSAEISTDVTSCTVTVPEAGVGFLAVDVAGEGPNGVGQRTLRCGRAVVLAAYTLRDGVPVGSGGATTGQLAPAALAADPKALLGGGSDSSGQTKSLYFGTDGAAVASAASASGVLPLGTVEGVTTGANQRFAYAQAAFVAPFD